MAGRFAVCMVDLLVHHAPPHRQPDVGIPPPGRSAGAPLLIWLRHGLELVSINPTMVLGPALGDFSHSIRTIKQMLDGQPGCPKINTCIVDVRDVADLHLRAMTNPRAAGERFLATSGESMWMVEIARLLKDQLGPVATKVSTRMLPSMLVRTIALTNPAMKGIVPLLGVRLDASGEKAKQMLGWAPRSPAEAILASAESLVRLGMVESIIA